MAIRITGHDIDADAQRVFDVVHRGGVAIIHLDVGYAVLGRTRESVERIYAAKRRSFTKPTGIVGNHALHEALHLLDERCHSIVRAITQDYDLPLAVIAPYRRDHPLLQSLDPFVLHNAVKDGTLNILLNAGALRNRIADIAVARSVLFVGSSANVSLRGIRYRLEDVDPELRRIADIEIDYGLLRVSQRGRQIEHDDRFLHVPRAACRCLFRSHRGDHEERFRDPTTGTGEA